MPRSTDIRPTGASLYFLPVSMRVPLKFGVETLSDVVCARVALRVESAAGRHAVGWGETPLSVAWVWPSTIAYAERLQALEDFARELAGVWNDFDATGHPIAVGHAFQVERLAPLLEEFNRRRAGREPMPWLAALVACSAFDLALHDAFGVLHRVPVYSTYGPDFMSSDLAEYIRPARGAHADFSRRYPRDFLVAPRPDELPAWHLVGGKDPLDASELDGSEPDDGYPVLLGDWVERDGLDCLKVKLRGNDPEWDHARLVRVGEIAVEKGASWLTADFNCTVEDPGYVHEILDRLLVDHPRLYGMLLYIEQPFPYDLEAHSIDVHSISARKPLFMDESAHDWKLVERGRELGWTGVALKTCKTQTGALFSLAWAKAHGMGIMVQDLTNPMLAQVPHVLLGAYAGTILGVETNSMQFYPEASLPEAAVHSGLYRRTDGKVSLETVRGPGFGYRIDEIERELPEPVVSNES